MIGVRSRTRMHEKRVAFAGHAPILAFYLACRRSATNTGGEVAKGPDTHHVVPNPAGGWDVRRGGADRASSHHGTKADAVARAREAARNQGTELRIHNKDGRIAKSDSHGNDPFPPRG